AHRLASLYQRSKAKEGETSTLTKTEHELGVPASRPPICMPGGGLFSTAEDYFRFLRMIQNGGLWDGRRYLRSATVSLMRTNQLGQAAGWVRFGDEVRDGFTYGYGFNAVTEESAWDPDAKPGEFGWGGKCSCHYWMHPENKLMVITLEQTLPYDWTLERALKGAIYEWERS
ncbi:MAG: serine hydrolase, partial [Verrucomicrobiota bacterium]